MSSTSTASSSRRSSRTSSARPARSSRRTSTTSTGCAGWSRALGGCVGAIGARTTAFKTVRIDEVALQRHGITVETLDLSDIFARVRKVSADARLQS